MSAHEVDLHEWLGEDVAQVPVGVKVRGITNVSQELAPDWVFMAIPGRRVNGFEMVLSLLNEPLAAVLYDAEDAFSCESAERLGDKTRVPLIAIRRLQQRQGELASAFYRHPSRRCQLVAITGTDGKTSVTHLLAQAIEQHGLQGGVVGTLGYGLARGAESAALTTPDPVHLQSTLASMVDAGATHVFMEASSHALDQGRLNGCTLAAAGLTNVGRDHLDYHETEACYQAAKKRLFDWPGLPFRVLNLDDESGQRWFAEYQGQGCIGYSLHAGQKRAAIRLIFSHVSVDGLEIVVQVHERHDASGPAQQIAVRAPLLGQFNISNLLHVVAVLRALGLEAKQIQAAMDDLKPIPGRMELYPARLGKPRIVVDFAHTDQALLRVLESLRPLTRGRIWCVFGCGGDRDRGKRPLMGAIAERLADEVVLTDDNPRFEEPQQIIDEILAGMEQPQQVQVIHDRRHAIEFSYAQAAPEDLVLVAGKGHETFQLVKDRRLPFSDRHVVEQLLGGAR